MLTTFLTTSLFALLLIILIYALSTRQPRQRKDPSLPKGDYQLVVVVNKDLGMSKGKVLSQFGHGIDSMHERLLTETELVRAWRASGSAKIALKGTQDDLNKTYLEAKAVGIPYVRVYDAGRTQVKAGSNTVVVIGPATKEACQPITGHLALY